MPACRTGVIDLADCEAAPEELEIGAIADALAPVDERAISQLRAVAHFGNGALGPASHRGAPVAASVRQRRQMLGAKGRLPIKTNRNKLRVRHVKLLPFLRCNCSILTEKAARQGGLSVVNR